MADRLKETSEEVVQAGSEGDDADQSAQESMSQAMDSVYLLYEIRSSGGHTIFNHEGMSGVCGLCAQCNGVSTVQARRQRF